MGSLAFAPTGCDQPLQQIHSDHVLIEKRLALLIRLKGHLRSCGCDHLARQTSSHILNCFDETAIRHHEDEELDLFPATLGTAPAAKRSLIRALIDHLAKQHRDLSGIWGVVRLQLLDVIGDRRTALDEALCESFHSIYVAHIEHEEGELLPLAHRCLARPVLDLLGRRMAVRRSVALPDPHILYCPFGRRSADRLPGGHEKSGFR